jgi:hypothetical protein
MDVFTNVHDPAGLRWLHKVLPAVYLVSSFGAWKTFAWTVNGLGWASHYDGAIGTFVAIAWLFFLLSLILATLVSMCLTFQREQVKEAFEKGYIGWSGDGGVRTTAEKVAVFVVVGLRASMLLMLLVCLAFVFLSLTIAGYNLVLGWTSFAVTIVVMGLTMLLSIIMEQKK